MNRNLYLVLGIILVLMALGFGAWSLLPGIEPSTQEPQTTPLPGYSDTYIPYPSGTSGPSAGTPEEQAARAAYEAALSVDNPDNIKVRATVVESGYALQVWIGDNTGGEALLKFDSAQNAWVIVDPGGGSWSLEGLVSFGVPEDTAQALLARVSH